MALQIRFKNLLKVRSSLNIIYLFEPALLPCQPIAFNNESARALIKFVGMGRENSGITNTEGQRQSVE